MADWDPDNNKMRSHLDHSPFLLRSILAHSLLRLRPLLLQAHVLALLTLAVFAALEAGLVALAVFFEAVGLFAVTAFDVLVVLNFLAEGVRVAIHEGHDGVVPLLVVDVQVVATHTVTPLTGLVESEAIAVKLEALGLLAVANHLLLPIAVLRHITS